MITECLGFVGGGFEECYDFLSRRYDFISEWGKKLLTVGIISVLIGGVIVYLNRRMKRYASTLDQSTEQKLKRQLTATNHENANVCVICQDCASSIVFCPCNHLVTCYNCWESILEDNLDCPVCRTHIDKTFYIFKK